LRWRVTTAKRFGASDSFNARENIEAGVKYLKHLNELYENDLRLALAAYNAGEGAVAKYGKQIPPYRETEHYVQAVGKKYGARRAVAKTKQQSAAMKPSPAEPEAERHPRIEKYIDAQGLLHLRTVPDSAPSNEVAVSSSTP
jgi:membrane-bound lytic murein transglycosylase MltF